MENTRLRYSAVFLSMLVLPAYGALAPANAASAQLHDRDGKSVGVVELKDTQNGTLFHADLKGLPEGTHAFHLHGVGTCEPPFKSAGGHFNPDGATHGIESGGGMHAGDMPNIHVPSSGALEFEVFNTRLKSTDAFLDSDGAAIVIHAGADDYKTDPAGAAGERIACGVVKQ